MEMKSALSITHSFASDFAKKFHTSVSHLFSPSSSHEMVPSTPAAPVASPQPYDLDSLLSSAFTNPPTESPVHSPELRPIDPFPVSSMSTEVLPSIPEVSPAMEPIAPPSLPSPPLVFKKNRRAYLVADSPVELLADSPIEPTTLVRTHEFYLCATSRGTVVSWLTDTACPLSSGLSDIPSGLRSSPCLIPSLHLELAYRNRAFHWVGHGGSFSVALSDAGEVYTWGDGRFGELGQGEMTHVAEPRLCVGLVGTRIVEVACGWDHVLAIDEKGRLFSWGHNDHGQLGHGDKKDRNEPCQVLPAAMLHMSHISAGKSFSISISTKGHLFGFGRNDQVTHVRNSQK